MVELTRGLHKIATHERWRPCLFAWWAVLASAACAALPNAAFAEVLLYRGDHVYVLPQRLTTRMLDLARRDQWRHFQEFSRNVDADGDGVDDFHAIAFGAAGGYGVQVRFRLHPGVETNSQRLGRWYWSVITGPDSKLLYQAFNQ